MFLLYNVEAIGKFKNVKKIIIFKKNLQFLLISFYHIDVETIGKYKM